MLGGNHARLPPFANRLGADPGEASRLLRPAQPLDHIIHAHDHALHLAERTSACKRHEELAEKTSQLLGATCAVSGGAGPMSPPQCLHRTAAGGRSSERHSGQVLVGGGSPNTTFPARAITVL